MRSPRSLTITALLTVTGALTLPLPAAADSFGLHIGSDGFGMSVSVGDYAPYGSGWHDPGWSLDFDAALAGYGEWVWVEDLGRTWRPYVVSSWQPYTHGRWVMTNLGWTWVAYEPWGYVPHHYGEWAMTSFGWVWAPGYTYRPAHVQWVSHGDYLGWYPCAPHGWSHSHRGRWHGSRHGRGHGSHGGYDRGYHDGWQDARYATFVSIKHMTSDNVARHAIMGHDFARSVGRSAIRALPKAPGVDEVERRIGRAIPRTPMSSREVRVGGKTVTVARPDGVRDSIVSHARETTSRALDPAVARRKTDRAPATSSRKPSETGRRPADVRGTRDDETSTVRSRLGRPGSSSAKPAPRPQSDDRDRRPSSSQVDRSRSGKAPSGVRGRSTAADRPSPPPTTRRSSPRQEASSSKAPERRRAGTASKSTDPGRAPVRSQQSAASPRTRPQAPARSPAPKAAPRSGRDRSSTATGSRVAPRTAKDRPAPSKGKPRR